MRLAKLSKTKFWKSDAQKHEKYEYIQQQQQQQQQSPNYDNKTQAELVKPKGSFESSSNNLSHVVEGNRDSFGNGSCISGPSTATTHRHCGKRNCNSKATIKTKTTQCLNSTVFRCCLPCRGGSGSAAPATSPPHTPTRRHSSVNGNSEAKRKYSGKLSDANESFIPTNAIVKKNSLADTIATSATTPLSLKTLINDEEEDLIEPPLSAADIAAATLASGILPRKAEPETLSDTSISPQAAVLQQVVGSVSGHSQLSSYTIVTSSSSASTVKLVTTTKTSPTSPTGATNIYPVINLFNTTGPPPPPPQLTQVSSTAAGSSGSSRVDARSCPPSQTSPLPHIQEEEETDTLINRQYNNTQDDESLSAEKSQLDQLIPHTAQTSGSSESCTSVSAAPAIGGITQDIITATPSPRIKLKVRKQHKSGWSRIIFAPSSSLAANSSETIASTFGSSTNNSSSVSTATISGGRLPTLLLASALAGAPQSSSSQLLAVSKMQAERGSIGDLQKYHTRYLKNRRHTLANVR